MRSIRFLSAFMCVWGMLVSSAFAADIASVSLVSLADNFNPWTITLQADGSVLWNNSSSGYLLMEPKLEEKKGSVPAAEVEKIFFLVTEAGYTQDREPPIEPGIKFIVVLANGNRVINCGPGDFAKDADKRAFRDIETALATVAGVDGDEKVFRYYNKKYGGL